jgi:hypothetical protein
MILVENKEARVLGPAIPKELGFLQLKPGINAVQEEYWEHALKTGFVKRRLGKTLIERGKTDNGKGLAGMAPLKALELVKGTLDIKQLEEWRESERRAKVAKAIDRQISVLNEGRRGSEES